MNLRYLHRKTMQTDVELEFLSNKYSLYHLEHFFCHLMENVLVSDERRHRIRLCFHEAVTNAVVHGNLCDESKYVYISLYQEADRLVFKIRDEGSGFQLGQIEDPLEKNNLSLPSGRGIFLMKEYADRLDYTAENTLIMEFSMR